MVGFLANCDVGDVGIYEMVGFLAIWCICLYIFFNVVPMFASWVASVIRFGRLRAELQSKRFGVTSKTDRNRRECFVRISTTRYAIVVACETKRAWKRRQYDLMPKIGVLPPLTREDFGLDDDYVWTEADNDEIIGSKKGAS